MVNWLLHVLGVDNVSGRYYGFWSGFGSDIGEVAIVGGLVTMVRKHNCHIHRCWRVGRHHVEGTSHMVCRRHHPDGPLTHSALLGQYDARQEAAPVRESEGG